MVSRSPSCSASAAGQTPEPVQDVVDYIGCELRQARRADPPARNTPAVLDQDIACDPQITPGRDFRVKSRIFGTRPAAQRRDQQQWWFDIEQLLCREDGNRPQFAHFRSRYRIQTGQIEPTANEPAQPSHQESRSAGKGVASP